MDAVMRVATAAVHVDKLVADGGAAAALPRAGRSAARNMPRPSREESITEGLPCAQASPSP